VTGGRWSCAWAKARWAII